VRFNSNLLKHFIITALTTWSSYPEQQFRKVGCNLGDPSGSYYEVVVEATKDIPVQVVFSNAGYLVMKSFPKTDYSVVQNNFNCNVVSHIQLAHYFFGRMMRENKRGCLVFTGSQAGFLPVPASTLYGAAKACLQQFASGLAIEGAPYGIHVTCIQAGPMHTRFADHLTKFDSVKQFYTQASTPQEVASVLFRSIGRVSIRDHSILTLVMRLILRILDVNWMIAIMCFVSPLMPDWKNHPDLH